MITIAKVQTDNKDVNELQQKIAQSLHPITSNPQTQGRTVANVTLASGTNAVQHGLSRVLQGWKIARQRGPANIYDNQDSNQTPSQTLTLISDADVSVDLYVW